MNVICASDPGFLAHMATMLLSLVSNNSQESVRIFVLFDGKMPGKDQMSAMLRTYQVDLLFISIEEHFPQNLLIKNGHVSRVTFARLLIGRFLPLDIDRVLYLDSDLIIRGDLTELWDHDLAGKTIGAIRDVVSYPNNSVLGLPPGAPYFNAGVMLIDLLRWREFEIGQRALDFACQHPDRTLYWDQCALNRTLYGDWVMLDPKWNFQTREVGKRRNGYMHFKRMPSNVRDTVRIVHFTGLSKPWHYENYHPLKTEYLEYRRRTPWPLERFEDRNPRNIIRCFLQRHLPLFVQLYYSVQPFFVRLHYLLRYRLR